MYDLWFTLGSAIIDPTVQARISAANTANPCFGMIPQRVIQEQDPATGALKTISNNTKTAGLLDPTQTPLFRAAVWTALPKNSPPVSLYTGGRIAQLLTVPGIQFATIMTNASAAYASAIAVVNPGPLPQAFPAVIGLCLLDSNLAGAIAKPGMNTPDSPALKEFMGEFGISTDPLSPERQVISNYVYDKAGQFAVAASTLLAGASTPWQELCGDQFFFWDPQNERAVL